MFSHFPDFASVISPRLPLHNQIPSTPPSSLYPLPLKLIVPAFECNVFSFTSSVSVTPYPGSFYLRGPVVIEYQSLKNNVSFKLFKGLKQKYEVIS